MIINQMFDALMKGDASVLITDNIRLLNEEALRLMRVLDIFLPIPSEAIPADSILREFIGGSCF